MKQFDLGAVTAYAIAVENGFKGTKQEWLDSLKGGVNVPFAQPGQLIIVKSVDEKGKPTEWEPVDRTHWTEGGVVEILPECQPTYEENDGAFFLTEPLNGELVVGNTCTVKWNGVEYQTVVKEITEDGITSQVLGDLYTVSGGAVGTGATGEPFAIVAYPLETAAEVGFCAAILPLDGSTALTLSIYGEGEIIHKLDNKYLDLDWLPVIEETVAIPETVVTGKNYDLPAVDGMQAAGKQVIIYVDGVRHECTTAGDIMDGFCVIIPLGTYGLCVFFYTNYTAATFMSDGAIVSEAEHTVSVSVPLPNKLPEEFLPKATAVPDAAGDTPTATEFNALLTALRDAGYLAT